MAEAKAKSNCILFFYNSQTLLHNQLSCVCSVLSFQVSSKTYYTIKYNNKSKYNITTDCEIYVYVKLCKPLNSKNSIQNLYHKKIQNLRPREEAV